MLRNDSRFDGRTWQDIPYSSIDAGQVPCRILWHAQRLMAEALEEANKARRAERIRPLQVSPLDANTAAIRAAQLVREEEEGRPELHLGAGVS